MRSSVLTGSGSFLRRRGVAAVAAVVVAGVSAVGGVAVRSSGAAPAPQVALPRAVSADALPTWQINGVVWSQTTVGDTVYATGQFTRARPPGAALGTQEVVRQNLLAYSISTGKLVTSFDHALNGPGLVVSRSPDGRRVYVGGDFTTVDGAPRSHVAAFDTATGALVAGFAPVVSNQVRAIAATATTVYVGGSFLKAEGAARTRLAAFDAAAGGLLPWAPVADNIVRTMVLTPDGSRVVLGGHFGTLNGTAAYGMGAVGASNGQVLPWLANQTIRDGGLDAAITTLRTDGRMIYGGGYAANKLDGNFEGTFAADPTTGAIAWLNDCHGDTYDVLPMGSVLYHAGHSHDCSMIGYYPEVTPRVWYHTVAENLTEGGVNRGLDSYGWNFKGWKSAAVLPWSPKYGIGSFTGQQQAAWSVTGNGTYLAVGGEFPTVNGQAQQGLVRFAVVQRAPNKMGPRAAPGLLPQVSSPAPGTVTVSFQATWDPDTAALTYRVVRDGVTVVTTRTVISRPWSLPAVTVTDAGVPKGTHTYTVEVADQFGNRVLSTPSQGVPVA